MRSLIKYFLSLLNASFYEKGLALYLLRTKFKEIRGTTKHLKREDLWLDTIQKCNNKVLFLEFGVWEGYSINFFIQNIKHKDSLFFGFDSFEGLPEDWYTNPKGTFNVKGKIPEISDQRVSFIKGWFNQSLPKFIDDNLSKAHDFKLIVHYDADLYSSTLFCLSQIDRLKIKYLAIFDEFTRDETRALYNYIQSHGATVKFLGHTDNHQVLCEIQPII
tara:strand:+ start:163905 stop:164558 length:654 start_codon:yes stop_codon:yes gene_type:complete